MYTGRGARVSLARGSGSATGPGRKGTMPGKNDSPGADTLTLDSDLAELERLRGFIDEFCRREGLPEESHYHLNVALEELVVNAIRHGACQPREAAIRLAMRMEGGEVRITLSDTGLPFDPLQAPAPDRSEER